MTKPLHDHGDPELLYASRMSSVDDQRCLPFGR